MYNVLLIADYIVKLCNEHGIGISNLKLQKLLYFVQAEFLVVRHEPCFPEEIEAWDFGPVVPEVYHKYKIYGSSNIPYFAGKIWNIADEDRKMIDEIVLEGAKYSAVQLVDITHRQTPWIDAYSPYCSNIITKKSIQNFFKSK